MLKAVQPAAQRRYGRWVMQTFQRLVPAAMAVRRVEWGKSDTDKCLFVGGSPSTHRVIKCTPKLSVWLGKQTAGVSIAGICAFFE